MKTVALLVVSAIAAASGRGQANWSTLTPAGEGFSIEVPGEPHPTKEAGHYVYGDDEHAYIIKVDPVSANVREFVEARAREPVDWPLDDGTHGFEVSQYMATPAHHLFMELWQSVVGKANSQFTGAVNLMMFDDHASIMREIETAIASQK